MLSDHSKYTFFMISALIVFPTIGALLIPRYGPFGFAFILFGITGVGSILYSKISLKKRTQKLIEWGIQGMTRKEKIMYFVGYSSLTLSILIIGYSFLQ